MQWTELSLLLSVRPWPATTWLTEANGAAEPSGESLFAGDGLNYSIGVKYVAGVISPYTRVAVRGEREGRGDHQ